MAFERASAKTLVPTAITGIRIILTEITNSPLADGTTGTVRMATYELDVVDQNGNRIEVKGEAGDLIQHLNPTQKQNLLAFVADLRTKAETELLPTQTP